MSIHNLQLNRRQFIQAAASAAAAAALAPRALGQPAPPSRTCDVCVYGGTSAGVIAAIQAARMDASVLLVEPFQRIGGMSTQGLGNTDIDNHAFQNSRAVGGLALQFYRRLAMHYGRGKAFDDLIEQRKKGPGPWRFEPSVAEKVLEDWLKEMKVTVLRGHRLAEKDGVIKDGPRITAIRCENGSVIQAQVFLDCTFEGDLLAFAGVGFAVGREGNAKYGETINGIRTNTSYAQIDKPIDPYIRPGDANSGVIHGVTDEPLGEHGHPSDAIQGFSFRTVFTRVESNRLPFEKPASYDPAHYELQRRYFAAGGSFRPGGSLPGGKCEPGSWNPLCGYLTGWNHDWNTATYARRDAMLQQSLEYVQGLYWFLVNAPTVPEGVQRSWASFGTCKDEFTDNGGWPNIFYVRNGRRMISDLVMVEAHGRATDPLPVSDPVGLVWWPHDLHSARRMVKGGRVWNEGAVFGHPWQPSGISYRCLVPKPAECTNLLTPTCPSTSYVAYGAYRVEWTFMVAAQSAATAAVQAIRGGTTVQNVPYAALREQLLKDNQILAVPQA
jgi:hypothetical protein